MSKHTPGRWHWWTSCSWKRLRSEDGMKTHDVVVPYVARSDGHPDLMISEADMRLIAAAPEMLEALEGCFALLATQKFEPDAGAPPMIKDGVWDRLVGKARAALAKARGE